MVKQFLVSACLLLLLAPASTAQDETYHDDPIIFSVNNTPVRVNEFQQIYSKSNQQKADYSDASVREYLDLYIKFKLKVQKAREMQLDTAAAFRSELEGYRRQLAASYLVDKEVTETFQQWTKDAEPNLQELALELIVAVMFATAYDMAKDAPKEEIQ